MARIHIVESDDTLSEIARTYYGDVSLYQKLAEYNGIVDPNLIIIGQVLEIPPKAELLRGIPEPPKQDHGIICPHGLEQIIKTFGNIHRYVTADGTLKPSWEAEHLGRVKLPFAIPLSWDRARNVTRLYCHNKLRDVFRAVFEELATRGLCNKIISYGGCFNYRVTRNSSKLSTHSWGIAIDLNPETNRTGTPGDMDPKIVAVFRQHGFKWGGDWLGRKDPMHFQFCSGY